jgi:hypothetical protein
MLVFLTLLLAQPAVEKQQTAQTNATAAPIDMGLWPPATWEK